MRLPPACWIPVTGVLLFFCGCAGLPEKKDHDSPLLFEPKPVAVEYGKASFYGGRWIGRLTASGERYGARDLTAAHKKLPFNTMVRVTNVANNRSVIVRINNRGPYSKGRILDLSVSAAREIDMIGAGIAKVKMEVLKPIEVMSRPNRVLPEGN
jgi:rare lipoprotein A